MIERTLEFDAASHSADAIQRAAYRLSDRIAIELSPSADIFRCIVSVDSDDVDEAERLVNDFRIEVIDHVLRERIRRETEAVRNVILALAFSRTSLVPPE